MDIRWLQDFLTVSETGSFTVAAQRSNVSVAAFSRRIKTLEWWLGTVLIDRTANPLRLTPEGELFREQAAEIVAQIYDAPLSFRNATMLRHQQLRIGVSYALASRLPAWWNRWSSALGPDVICSVVTGSLQDCVTALISGSVDLVACHQYRPVEIALPEDQFDRITFGRETLAPFASLALLQRLTPLYPGRKSMILTNDETLSRKFNSAVFPGIQGGPLMHVIAAKAVALGEALDPSFRDYAQQGVANARALGAVLMERGLDLVTGGTDTHLVLVDLRSKSVTGRDAELSLERARLTCNKNGIPYDPLPTAQTSGIRLGTTAGTTRGFGEREFRIIGHLIADVVDGLTANGADNGVAEEAARAGAWELTEAFPCIAPTSRALPPSNRTSSMKTWPRRDYPKRGHNFHRQRCFLRRRGRPTG